MVPFGRHLLVGASSLAASLVVGAPELAAAVELRGSAAVWPPILATVGLVVAGAGLAAAVFAPALLKSVIPAPSEDRLSDKLSFLGLAEDGRTLRTKDGGLSQTVQLRGIDFSSSSEEETAQLFEHRQAAVMALADGAYSWKIMSIRDKIAIDSEGTFPTRVLQQIHDRWAGLFSEVYVNRHFLVVALRPGRGGQKKLDEGVSAALNALHRYQPKVLEGGELLSFWARRVNGFDIDVPPIAGEIGDLLAQNYVAFEERPARVVYSDGTRERVAGIVTVKSWGRSDAGRFVDRVMALRGRLELVQLCEGQSRARVVPMLALRAKQAMVLGFNRIKAEEFEAAGELIGAERDSLVGTQLMIVIEGDDDQEVEELVDAIRNVAADFGHQLVYERMALEWQWRSRLPGFGEQARFMVRPRDLLASNLAALHRWQAEPSGLDRSDWGPGPVRLFRTVSGGAYSLQLHVSRDQEAVAHTITLAPTGGGKTTLWAHLIGGALRHKDLAAYVFDRHAGLKVFTRGTGGRHIVVGDDDGDVQLNPLQIADSPSNRDFLVNWLMGIAEVADDDSKAEAERAVAAIFGIRRRGDRSLRAVYESGFDTGSALRRGLGKWVRDGYEGRIFNGATDSLNLEGSRLVTFEMEAALKRNDRAAALVTYILHRIRETCTANATPHLVFIDETAPMLGDPAFRQQVEIMYREHRKLRGSVNVVFQDVRGMMASGIAETVVANSGTQFIFQNPRASREDYRTLDLTEAQIEWVKGTSRLARELPYAVLVKRNSEAVILDVDLSGLGPLLRVYRSGIEASKLVDELRRKYGGESWVEEYVGETVF